MADNSFSKNSSQKLIPENLVFISYPPDALHFASRLYAALKAKNFDPWIDLDSKDLPIQVTSTELQQWAELDNKIKQAIEKGIDEAEIFICIVSPSLLNGSASRSLEELKEAVQKNKRCISIWLPDLEAMGIPDSLREITRLSITGNDSGTISDIQVEEITRDIIHIHYHEQLDLKARKWEEVKGKYKTSLLLQKWELEEVQILFQDNDRNKRLSTSLNRRQKQLVELSKEKQNSELPSIFISYSRRDKSFVEALCLKLGEEFNFWIDWKSIPIASAWQTEIKKGIQAAHSFLFVISPDSFVSKYCQDELTHAIQNGKRLISIEWRSVSKNDEESLQNQEIEEIKELRKNWKELRKYNTLVLKNEDPDTYRRIEVDDFHAETLKICVPELLNKTFEKLKEAITQDYEYAEEHRDCLIKALKWVDTGRQESALLHTQELRDARRWLRRYESWEEKQKQILFLIFWLKYYWKQSIERSGRTAGIRYLGSIFVIYYLKKTPVALSHWLKTQIWKGKQKQQTPLIVRLQPPTPLQREFIAKSEIRKRENRKKTALLFLFVFVLAGGLFGYSQKERTGKVGALISSLERYQGLEALLTGLYMGNELKELKEMPILTSSLVSSDLQVRAITALHQGIYAFRERNRLNAGHKIFSIAFSPDGSLIASANERETDDSSGATNNGGTVWLFTKAGEPIAILKGHTSDVVSIAFNPDGHTLASASRDGTIRLWDIEQICRAAITSNLSQPPEPNQPPCEVAGRSNLLQPIEFDQPLQVLDKHQGGHEDAVYTITFSLGGYMLASASRDGTVKLWTWTTQPKKSLKLNHTLKHSAPVARVVFNRNGDVVTGSQDGFVTIWSSKNNFNQPIAKQQHSADLIYSIACSPDGKIIASASDDGTIKLWRQNGQLIRTLQGHESGIYQVVFSPDSQILASASDDGSVRLWQREGSPWENGSQSTVLRGHQGAVYRVQFSPDGRTIATAGADDTVKLWSIAISRTDGTAKVDGTLIDSLEGHRDQLLGLAFAPNGKILASGSIDGEVRMWQVYAPEDDPVQVLQNDYRVYDISFRPPNGTMVATGSWLDGSGQINLWRTDGSFLSSRRTEEKSDSSSSGSDILSLSFSPDGNLLASAAKNGKVVLWRLDGTQFVRWLSLEKYQQRANSVAFSANGQWLAAGGIDGTDGVVKLWRLNPLDRMSSKPAYTLKGTQGEILSVSLSWDGQWLAAAGEKGGIDLWTFDQAGMLQYKKLLQGHQRYQGKVLSINFDPTGQILASGGEDKTIRLWRVDRLNQSPTVLTGHLDAVSKVAFNPNGNILASASRDRFIKLWTRDGTPLITFKRHEREVSSVSFNPNITFNPEQPNRPLLASASYDERAILWGLPNFYGDKALDRQVLDTLIGQGCDAVHDYLATHSITQLASEPIGAINPADLQKIQDSCKDQDSQQASQNQEEQYKTPESTSMKGFHLFALLRKILP